MPSLDVGSSAKLTWPSPVTSGFTLYSMNVFAGIAARSSMMVAPGVGWLDHLIPVSVHPLAAERSAGPSTVSVVDESLSLACSTVPVTPVTLKRR